MEREELISWLRLTRTPGIGPVTFHRLLEKFSSPSAVLAARPEQLFKIADARPALINSLATPPSVAVISQEILALEALGGHIITSQDQHYPPLLRNIHDPPPVLYLLGNPRALIAPHIIAIVGTRNATRTGIKNSHQLGRDLARIGITTASGFAIGIDGAAHRGTVEEGGVTIAVTATGLNVDYPKRHNLLRQQILEKGCIVTEAPLSTFPSPRIFPSRNRIISGISQGVVVVEAAPRSGSLITARTALEQGRELFALPGPIDEERSKGTNQLLRDGACLVTSVEDIKNELTWSLPSIAQTPLEDSSVDSSKWPPNSKQLLEKLEAGPLLVDELARLTHLTVGELSSILLQLEMSGIVEKSSDDRYIKC